MPTTLRCEPRLFEKDLKGQVMIVTGANSGCGLETSRQLAKQGAIVILACRSTEKGEAAATDVGGVFIAPLDLGSLDSVREFVKIFLEKYDRLDVLVNNAGIMACPFVKTKDGFEMQIGCNHLAHFLLMRLLTPLLLKTADTSGKPSRFVALSSAAASESTLRPGYAEIDFDDLMWEKKEYNEGGEYQQSKLANYLHAIQYSNLDAHVFKRMFGDNVISKFVGEVFRKVVLLKGDMAGHRIPYILMNVRTGEEKRIVHAQKLRHRREKHGSTHSSSPTPAVACMSSQVRQ